MTDIIFDIVSIILSLVTIVLVLKMKQNRQDGAPPYEN